MNFIKNIFKKKEVFKEENDISLFELSLEKIIPTVSWFKNVETPKNNYSGFNNYFNGWWNEYEIKADCDNGAIVIYKKDNIEEITCIKQFQSYKLLNLITQAYGNRIYQVRQDEKIKKQKYLNELEDKLSTYL